MIPGDFFGETGGPAFPHSMQMRDGDEGGTVTYHGLTARDYFAIHANASEVSSAAGNLSITAREKLVGRTYPKKNYAEVHTPADVIASVLNGDAEVTKRLQHQNDAFKFELEVIAKMRYMMADAMLAAREA